MVWDVECGVVRLVLLCKAGLVGWYMIEYMAP